MSNMKGTYSFSLNEHMQTDVEWSAVVVVVAAATTTTTATADVEVVIVHNSSKKEEKKVSNYRYASLTSFNIYKRVMNSNEI